MIAPIFGIQIIYQDNNRLPPATLFHVLMQIRKLKRRQCFFFYFLMLKASIAVVDLYENYIIDIRLTKCDRGHKRSSKQHTSSEE